MNFVVYIFGELSSGYTQYPEDSSSNILKNLYSKCKATTQIVIHRDSSMMYYSYIRKISENRYIGFSIAVNGYFITKIEDLFTLFENTIEKIAKQGAFIHFSDDGSLTTSSTKLCKEEEEIDTLSDNLRRAFDNLGSFKSKLPQENYSVAKDSVKEFNIFDDKRDIVRATYTYGYTFIYKNEDFNTVRMNSYQSVLSRLNETNLVLRKENKELQENNQEILRQKKQFRNVILLIFVVIGCSIGIFFLYNNLNSTQWQLDKANSTIAVRNNKISRLKNSIDSLQYEYNEEHRRKVSLEEDLLGICGQNPFVVTNCSVVSDEFSFDYYADEEKDVTVTLKAINNNNSEIVANSHSITVEKGTGSMKLKFYYKLNASDYYYVVLMYDGHIIAGKYW